MGIMGIMDIMGMIVGIMSMFGMIMGIIVGIMGVIMILCMYSDVHGYCIMSFATSLLPLFLY